MINSLVLKGDKFICIKDFYSLNGKVIFTEGLTYISNNDRCIISGGYNLHVDNTFFIYFRLINRTR